jgi:DNA invertase Pin-like site-specific DNA recombinase
MTYKGDHFMIVGYARVSTIDKSLNLQLDALNEFGCDEILKKWFQEPKMIAQYSFSRNSNNF